MSVCVEIQSWSTSEGYFLWKSEFSNIFLALTFLRNFYEGDNS